MTAPAIPKWVTVADRAWAGLEPCGVLASYWKLREMDAPSTLQPWRDRDVPLFCDSGAFSAFAAKKVIGVDEYGDWLLEHKDLFRVYANLDVIGNEHATADNQAALEARGLAPLPVFHIGASWDVLDALADKYSMIALGGLVAFRRGSAVGPWLARAFNVVGGRAGLHGFGITRWQFLRDFPWATVDSTTFKSGQRYGAQLVWIGHKLIQLDRASLVANAATIERNHKIKISQALAGVNGDYEMSNQIGLQAIALAQANRRRHNPDFIIYCSGVHP